MRTAARILMILAAIFSLALLGLGIASIVLIYMYLFSTETQAMVVRVLTNFGLLGENSFLAMIFGNDPVVVISFIATIGIIMGVMAIPCGISCLVAIKRHSIGRFVGCIITGAIGYNVLAIIAGIINIVVKSKDKSY